MAGPKVFATWEEAELFEEPMVTERGTADIEQLGVTPASRCAVSVARLGPAAPRLHRRTGRSVAAERQSSAALHHSVHAAHAARHSAAAAVLLRHLGDDRLGGEDVLRRSTPRSAARSG